MTTPNASERMSDADLAKLRRLTRDLFAWGRYDANETISTCVREIDRLRSLTAVSVVGDEEAGEMAYRLFSLSAVEAERHGEEPSQNIYYTAAKLIERLSASYSAACGEREAVAAWMLANSYATGHGDTTQSLIAELDWQHKERFGELSDWAKGLDAQIFCLAQERDEALAQVEAFKAKIDSLAPHGTCGCSYDRPEDKCAHHSPQLSLALVERDRAREALEFYAADRNWQPTHDDPEVPGSLQDPAAWQDAGRRASLALNSTPALNAPEGE